MRERREEEDLEKLEGQYKAWAKRLSLRRNDDVVGKDRIFMIQKFMKI